MHRLSIVIPCPIMDQRAEDTLVSVLENRPAHCEVIVVTAGKYDDPYDLTGEVKFVEEEPSVSTMRLVNSGIEVASSDVVHILRPGAKAVEGWTDGVLAHFDDPQVAAVAPAVVRSAADERAILLGVDYRPSGKRSLAGKKSRVGEACGATMLAPSCHGGFYRHDILAALDGFDESMTEEQADIEFGLAIRQLGYRTRSESSSRIVVEQPALPCKSQFRTARGLERLYRRYSVAGAWTAIVHCLVFITDVVGCFPRPAMVIRLLGRLSAWCEPRIQQRQQERIHRAQAYLAKIATAQMSGSTRKENRRTRPQPVATALQRKAA